MYFALKSADLKPQVATMFYEHITHAITRGLPRSFSKALQMDDPPVTIDVEIADKQHEEYNAVLKSLVKTVIHVPADEACPDAVFIEDTAFFVQSALPGGATHVVITLPGAPSRRPEVEPVHAAIRQLGLPASHIHQLQAPATLDGGDVMFTGREVWIGRSKRTNQDAVDQVAAALEPLGLAVIGFDMGAGGHVLHLKSALTLLDDGVVLVGDCDVGRHLVAQAEAHPVLKGKYQYIYVPDVLASNVLRIGKHVVFQGPFPRSEAIVRAECEKRGLTLHTVCMSELAKADGALTCCSLLFGLQH